MPDETVTHLHCNDEETKMLDATQFQQDPRAYAYDLVENGLVTTDTMLTACLQYLSHDDCREMLDANELSPRFDPDADEETDNEETDNEEADVV